MPSGFSPVGDWLIDFRVFRSKIVTLFAAAIADEAAIQLRSNGDSVHARRVRNIADDLVRLEVDNHDVRRVRHIQSPGGAVDRQVVPAAFAADLDVPGDVISGRCRHQQHRREQDETKKLSHVPLHSIAIGLLLSVFTERPARARRDTPDRTV